MEDKLKAFEGGNLNEVCSQYRTWVERPPKKRIFDTNIAACEKKGTEFSGYWYVLLVRWNDIRKDRELPRSFDPGKGERSGTRRFTRYEGRTREER